MIDDGGASAHAVHPWVAEGQPRIRFGIGMLGARADWPRLHDCAQQAEALGFDSWWSQDHPIGGVDCWTTLAGLAVATSRIRLGTSVACVYYRSPAVLARLAADVDRMSGGRFILGLGIGDDADEFAQLVLPFPRVPERQQALEEAIAIVRGVWGEEPFTYEGRHFRVSAVTVQPPVQRPRVPLLIAGGGERVTLRQVAKYADMANFGENQWTGRVLGLDDVRRRLDALRHHCEALNRPYESILRSHIELPLILAPTRSALDAKLAALPRLAAMPSLVAGTPEEIVAYYRALVEAGMQYFIAALPEFDVETLRLLGREVIPALTAG